MKKILKITLIIAISGILNPYFNVFAVAGSQSTDINLQVTAEGVCNSNGVCESALGENETNCAADCGCNNNGICQSARGENSTNCLPDCPVTPTPVPMPPDFDLMPPVISNILVKEITLDSAIIEWDVSETSLCQVFWGVTQDYEKEIIFEKNYTDKKHSTSLLNLAAGTLYHFKIRCKDRQQNQSETKDQQFITLFPPDTTPPANVTNFTAIPGDSQITLSWKNPEDSDFKGVRIVRSTVFYPSNPWEGILVYDGKDETFVDTGLKNGVRYYYTAFAYDYAGNFSSGAVVSEVPFKIAPPIEPPIIPPVIPPEVIIPPEIEKLKISDFNFWQGDKKLEIAPDGSLEIKTKEPINISIDYDKVPEVLKTIMVTLIERSYLPANSNNIEEKKYFSFLLRVNKEKTAFTATIMPPEKPNVYPFILSVFDYKNQALKNIFGQLQIFGSGITTVSIPWYKDKFLLKNILYLLLLVILLTLIAWFLNKKIKNKLQDSKSQFGTGDGKFLENKT